MPHNLEPVAGDIGLHMNADKPKCSWFNQKGVICTLNGGPTLAPASHLLKNDVNIWLAKA